MGIRIRKASINDAEILFNWANDPYTRKNSFDSTIIKWNDHLLWLKKKLGDPNSIIYILLYNKKPIGVVRFEVKKDASIGITVAPNHRGLGLGSEILKIACNTFWENSAVNILAYIKKGNIASQRVFEKAGFAFLSENTFNGFDCLILISKRKC